ncbi:MAG: glycosyltransferase family 4 protein [Terriglobales bacterium]
MRVLTLNQFFYPDISATSQLMTDLAEDLAAQGAEVTALASNVSYTGGKSFPRTETYGDVRIERVPVIAFDRANILRRIGSYLSFYISAFFRLLRLPKQDVILVLTTPPLVAIVAWAIRLIKGSRFVYLVQDLYPDIAYAFGMMKQKSLAGRLLDAIALFLLQRAGAVIALGACMHERLLAKGVSAEKVHVIPNWADGTQIVPIPRTGNSFRAAHGLEGKFVVLYSGNMGRAHDFTAMLTSMERLQSEKDIVFVFIGAGPKKAELEKFVKTHADANVRILDYVPREELKLSMGAADLSIVAVADGLEGLVVPSKLYGIMASGRPALYVGPASSEAARTITAHRCGFVVSNADADGFTQSVLSARADVHSLQAMGIAARQAFDQKFDRSVATRRYFDLLTAVTKV